MKYLTAIIILILFLSCSDTNFNDPFRNKTFEIVNIYDAFNSDNIHNYAIHEFLDSNIYIFEGIIDSNLILNYGYYKYFTENNRQLIAIGPYKEIIDTFQIIDNRNFKEFKIFNSNIATISFKQIKESVNFDKADLIDHNWICLNDSTLIGFDSISGAPKFGLTNYYFNSNMTYSFKKGLTNYKGTWTFNDNKNRILLNNQVSNFLLIKIKNITSDSLIIWQQSLDGLKELIFIKNN